MKIFLSLGLWLLPIFVFAYNPAINNTTVPYEPMVINPRIEEGAEYLGQLVGDPQMYEFTIGVESVLSLRVAQAVTDEPLLLSLIAVKENTHNAGVVEVGRLSAKEATLQLVFDPVLGMKFLETQFFNATITPGTYRVEVSTPDNYGKYMLRFGTEPKEAGYFATLADIRMVQKFFDHSIFRMFMSSAVYYPLGVLILIGLIYFTWRNRELIRSKHA